MIILFLSRARHAAAGLWQLRRQGLTLVEPLGADLAGVVDPHEAGDMAALLFAKFGVGQSGGGIRALGDLGWSEQGANGLIEADQQLVRGSEIAILHGGRLVSEVVRGLRRGPLRQSRR